MGDAPHWFQAFMYQDREITTSLLRRAEASGFSAIVLTVDNEAPGWRIRRMRSNLSRLDVTEANLRSDPVLKKKVESGASSWRPLRGRRSWEDFDFVRKTTSLPLVIKGITHPIDAALALEHGADGIIVSNHGGRQLDHEVATIDALPAVCEAVKSKIPVLVDGGVRQAIDAIKALALGASAVLAGRLYVTALSVGGEQGVTRVLENFVGEMRSEMQNLGCRDVGDARSIRVIRNGLVVREGLGRGPQ